MTIWIQPGRGTEDALVEVMQAIRYARGKCVLQILLDIARAVDNTLLWAKIIIQLKEFGVRGKELDVIKDYFREICGIKF